MPLIQKKPERSTITVDGLHVFCAILHSLQSIFEEYGILERRHALQTVKWYELLPLLLVW